MNEHLALEVSPGIFLHSFTDGGSGHYRIGAKLENSENLPVRKQWKFWSGRAWTQKGKIYYSELEALTEIQNIQDHARGFIQN